MVVAPVGDSDQLRDREGRDLELLVEPEMGDDGVREPAGFRSLRSRDQIPGPGGLPSVQPRLIRGAYAALQGRTRDPVQIRDEIDATVSCRSCGAPA